MRAAGVLQEHLYGLLVPLLSRAQLELSPTTWADLLGGQAAWFRVSLRGVGRGAAPGGLHVQEG